MRKSRVIAEAFVVLVILQVLLEALERLLLPLFPDTTFAARMTTMTAMIILSGATVLYAKRRETPLTVFPEKFGARYIVCTCIAALLLVTAPSNFTAGWRAVALLFYGSVVTPVFEELVFRGYLWNRLNGALSKEVYTYIWSVALFTLWHLGYMLPQLAEGNWIAVGGKLAAGLGYGAVLGFIRLKTKNCYSTMLAHGVLNLFMI